MKKTLHILFATLAATVALTGCVQEIAPSDFENDKVNPAAEGSRVIAVSFAPQSQTKTTLEKDGLTPNFVKGDKILVANGQDEPDTCVVSVKGGKATISTNLTGPLNAVYPAKAAKMNDSNPKQIDTVLVSANQSGTFADANICMAKDITDEAVFQNKTAVLRFYVDESIGVTSVKVTSQSEEITPNKGMEITVQTDGGTLFGLKGNIDQRICYVAIPSGQYTKLTLSSTANTQTPEPRELDNVTLNIGTMYNAFIPYYIQVGDQKWAYCNIGAFLPEEPGLYFAWGDTKGYRWDAKAGRFEEGHAFNWENCPFNNGYSYGNTTYLKSVLNDNFTKIDEWYYAIKPTSDAANLYWGENWHIPTYEEAGKLEKTNPAAENISDNVLTIPGSSLKIPISGKSDSGNPSGLTNATSGYFWKATVYYPNNDLSFLEFAGVVSFTSGEGVYFSSGVERNIGLPIRPIYAGPAPAPEKPTSLSGVFTVGEGKAVRFSRGNLYWDGTSSPGAYKFETEQYNYRLYPGKASDYAFLDKSTVTPENTVGSFWWIKNGETAGTPYSPEYNIETELCSGNDILFTNETAITPNTDFTVNGDKGVWRALSGGSGGEWEYLLEKRKDAAEKVGTATVNGVTGTILLPDTFTDPSVNSASGGGAFVPLDSIPEDMNFGDNIYDLDSWEKMESEGAVFLPAAGHVQTDVDKNQTKCHYWSSSALTGLTSYSIMIDLTDSPGHYGENSYLTSCQSPRSTLRISVRLVTDAPVAGSTVDDLKVWEDDKSNWE